MKEKWASEHIYPECTGEYTKDYRNSNYSFAYICNASKDLEDRLIKLQKKLKKLNGKENIVIRREGMKYGWVKKS